VRLCHERYPNVGIEFHGHNDTGCALANTIAGMEGGADCLDVTVLGIGERNGIAALSGVIAQLYIHYPELLEGYDLGQLAALDYYVADCLQINVPFNMPITAPGAFTHRAGVHTRAVLRNPRAYEALNPNDFGLDRRLDIGSRYTGRHAVGQRATELGMHLGADEVSLLTTALKARAEAGALSLDEVDAFLRSWYVQQRTGIVAERG
jgi:homocitrate synthase